MATARFFVEGVYGAGQTLTLAGDDSHKILDVLRKRSGDTIQIVDSTAQRFEATLEIVDRTVRARLGERFVPAIPERFEITVAQGLPKGQKMDFVVEKLTGLGAATIVPLYSERSVVVDTGSAKIDRWRRLAKTAAAQCGRDKIPEVTEPLEFQKVVASFSDYDCVLFPWELAEQVSLRSVLPELIERAGRILVVIGPEGGFSHAEAEAAQRHGAHVVGLGTRILRTDTAALVVVALLNYVSGV